MLRYFYLVLLAVFFAGSSVSPSKAVNLLVARSTVSITASGSIIKDCDSALIKATYNKIDYEYTDWRLAEQVDQATYNQIKNSAGVDAVIYGVPVGANYDAFEENIRTLKQSRQESYTSERFRNVIWTGLTAESVTAYQECLKAAASAARKAIILIPDRATASDVTFKLQYTPAGAAAPNPLPVTWSIGEGNVSNLPTRIPAGITTILVKRPATRDVSLIINAPGVGDSDSVVLTPMPAPLPPDARYASKCEILTIPEPRPILSKGGTVSWPCPQMKAGTYAVTMSITPGSNIPARVGYGLAVISNSQGGTTTFDLPLTSGNPVDINVEAGLPHVFQSIGSTVRLPQGAALFRLNLGWIFNHCCFSGDGNAGVVTIPPNVILRLERLEGSSS